MSSKHSILRAVAAVFAALAMSSVAPAATSGPTPSPGKAKVLLETKEALALAFPGGDVARETFFLSDKEKERVSKLAGARFQTGLAFRYVAKKGGLLLGTAYFDTHRVRTMKETVMIVVAPNGTIARVEVLAFAEPLDYKPREKWYAQYVGKKLDADLELKRSIRGVTGATLTARATTEAARRVLALHGVVEEKARGAEGRKRRTRPKASL